MKNPTLHHRTHAKGFTLIEILVTVSIMVVLMGMTFAIGKWALENSQVEKAKAQIKLMENRLEEYNVDNGEFPPGDGSERSSRNIYDYLYERGVQDGTSKVYMADLDPDGNDKFNVTKEGIIYDPFKKNKKPYFYMRGVDENGERVGDAYNPDFDLWSVGLNGRGRGSEGATEEDEEDDITNWD
jgi:prepilin-type N-terminal cleavage/methylation domain-containing protein